MTDSEIIANAQKAFGGDPVSALVLRVRQLQRHSEERLAALNENAAQARKIAALDDR